MKQFFLLLAIVLLVGCQQDLPNLETNLEGTVYYSEIKHSPNNKSTIVYHFEQGGIGTKVYFVYNYEMKAFFEYSIEEDQLLLNYGNYVERGQIIEYTIMMSTIHSYKLFNFYRHGKMGRY